MCLYLEKKYAIQKQEAQRATYRAPEYNVPHLLPHLGFSDRLEKHKLGSGRSSYQVSSNSIQGFQSSSKAKKPFIRIFQ